ncbi:MAG: hypothetical protein ABL958_03760 [Bdellovibrionia bacterium]
MKILMSLAALLVSASAFAAPSAKFVYRSNISNGQPSLHVSGRDLYDSDVYRLRVTDSLTGDSGWYTSNSGKTQWDLQNGNLTMQLQQSILVPGFVIELRTYRKDAYGQIRKTHSFAKRIPCRPDQYASVFADEIWIYDGEQIGNAGECNVINPPSPPPPPPPPPPTPTPLTCSVDVRVTDQSRVLGAFRVACSEAVGTDVRIYNSDNGSILCSNPRFYASPMLATACTFNRNPNVKLPYMIEIRTATGELFTRRDVLVKDPTWAYQPEGAYSHGLTVVTEKKKKALGRGFYWPAKITARVSDGDVDPSEGNSRIKVELVLIDGGGERVLKTAFSNSQAQVSFEVEHEYVDPFFGQPKHRGDLNHGDNRLRIRVWDAYEGQGHIDLPEVHVQVNE